ncbi:RNA polymerase III subunit Rpc25-domain-containing protein, partial [Hyaloraphidium curvatum]
MFVLSLLKDVVQVAPSEFGKTRNAAVTDALNKKYANKVLHNVGLCIRVFDLLALGEAEVDACFDGSYRVKVRFRLVCFRPQVGEVLVGKVVSSSPGSDGGIKVSMDFFDDIFIPESQLPPNSEYNVSQAQFVWKFETENGVQELPLDRSSDIVFRVLMLKFIDTEPVPDKMDEQVPGAAEPPAREVPFQVIGSIQEEGMGLYNWW